VSRSDYSELDLGVRPQSPVTGDRKPPHPRGVPTVHLSKTADSNASSGRLAPTRPEPGNHTDPPDPVKRDSRRIFIFLTSVDPPAPPGPARALGPTEATRSILSAPARRSSARIALLLGPGVMQRPEKSQDRSLTLPARLRSPSPPTRDPAPPCVLDRCNSLVRQRYPSASEEGGLAGEVDQTLWRHGHGWPSRQRAGDRRAGAVGPRHARRHDAGRAASLVRRASRRVAAPGAYCLKRMDFNKRYCRHWAGRRTSCRDSG